MLDSLWIFVLLLVVWVLTFLGTGVFSPGLRPDNTRRFRLWLFAGFLFPVLVWCPGAVYPKPPDAPRATPAGMRADAASEAVAWAVLVHLAVGLVFLPGRRDWVAVCGMVLVSLTLIARDAVLQAVYGWGLIRIR
ncbi:MAG TPA: hypothetical protein VH092_31855 [Urbifossiella sp.]|nr:hypothetical protein [Urbifossiella sp.]